MEKRKRLEESNPSLPYDVVVGCNVGSVWRFSSDTGPYRLNELNYAGDPVRVTSLKWTYDKRTLLVGYGDGTMVSYNFATDTDLPSKPHDHALLTFIPLEHTFLTIHGCGVVMQSKEHSCFSNVYIFPLKHKAKLTCALHNPYDANTVIFGGYRANLNILDLEVMKVKFNAKNERCDAADLNHPLGVKNVTGLPPAWGMDCAAANTFGKILLYDSRTQRRAVKVLRNSNSYFTSLAPTKFENQMVAGDKVGNLQLIDLRYEPNVMMTFKDNMGAFTDIWTEPNEPYCMTASLDKHINIYDLAERKLELRINCKLRLSSLVRMEPLSLEPIENCKEDALETKSTHGGWNSDFLAPPTKRAKKKNNN